MLRLSSILGSVNPPTPLLSCTPSRERGESEDEKKKLRLRTLGTTAGSHTYRSL